MDKNNLQRQFREVVRDVASKRPDYFHRKMPDIRRAMGPIDKDHPFFDPDLILAHGIAPRQWQRIHALGFAKETLAITGYNTHPEHGELAYVRCMICLLEKNSDSFGHFLHESVKKKLRDFLQELNQYKPTPERLAIYRNPDLSP